MEGVAGVVTADQPGPGGFEYERFRHFMTNETLAAVHSADQSNSHSRDQLQELHARAIAQLPEVRRTRGFAHHSVYGKRYVGSVGLRGGGRRLQLGF